MAYFLRIAHQDAAPSLMARIVHRSLFPEDEYVEFSKLSQNLVLGTQRAAGALQFTANVYDISTSQRITQLVPRDGNGYLANRATFDPTDELVLNNGVLFDVRTPREVHKFDKFNNTISGVFHPNGLEIVANTEVWDMRTFHLLRTVPALQQCRVQFANNGDVMFGVKLDHGSADADDALKEVTAFKVIDAVDYTSIGERWGRRVRGLAGEGRTGGTYSTEALAGGR